MTLDAPWSDANGDEMERGDADPPSPLTALAAIVHDDIANGRTDEEIVRHVLDAARAPDAGLRAAAEDVASRMSRATVTMDTEVREVPNGVIASWRDTLRAALASSPAPAGPEAPCPDCGHPNDWHEQGCVKGDCDRRYPAPAGLDVERLWSALTLVMAAPTKEQAAIVAAEYSRAATRPAEDAKP